MTKMAKPKINELSSREDFVVEQFATMKKVNKICNKLFSLYYIDVDRNSELSPMMRSMVPLYYVDPNNPEHPGCYILAGRSLVDYLERIVYVSPYVDAKGKYAMDLSGWKGLLVTPTEFEARTKDFRKSRLEPMVIMGERGGERFNQSLILRESNTAAKQELVLPFLQLPNRKMAGEDAYQQALRTMIYNPFYQYLDRYLYQGLKFTSISKDDVDDLFDNGMIDMITEDGDIVTVTRGIFPSMTRDQLFSIAKVPQPDVDTSGGRFHYVVLQEDVTETGTTYIATYTLLAALQMRADYQE